MSAEETNHGTSGRVGRADRHGRWTEDTARLFYGTEPKRGPVGPKGPLHAISSNAPPPRGGRDLTPEEGGEIVNKADGWRDTPYASKGTPHAGPNAEKGKGGGGDCSGIVNKIYGESGHPYDYKRSDDFPGAAERGKIPFREVDPKDRQPGDVVVYEGQGHMAIYAGNGDVYSAHQAGSAPFNRLPGRVFGGRPRYFRYQDRSQQA